MFCSNCGKEARDGDKFCWNCGRPLSGDTESEGETKEEHPSPHDTADDREIASEGEFPQDVEQAGITSSDASNDAMVGFDAGSDVPEVEEWQDVDASSFEATQETPAVTVPAPDMYQMPAQNPYQAFPQGHPQMQANPYGGGMPQGQQMSGSMPATKVPWYMTTPARIALGVLGVFMMVRGILTIGSAFTDKKPEPDDTTHSPRTVTVPPKAEQGVDGTDGGDLIDGGDGQDIIVADPDDIVISDPNDIVIRKPSSTDDSTSGNDDVTYGGGEKFDSWAEECVDENGNPTVYAIVELKGWQLETLCQEKGLEWNEGSMQWEGEKKTVCGKETGYTQFKYYGADGEYACAELALTRDGKVVVMPHEYGTYTFKDGWYSEMGREAIKDAIVWVDKNTMKGTWKKRHDIWKKTDLPDETVKYILERCKTLETPQIVEQQIKSTCFK